jgi:uncharacterized RDD family membrane protein YckC
LKKITEIYIEKEYQKSERDFLGNRIKVPTIGKFKRDVVLAGQWERLGHYIIDFAIILVFSIIIGIVLIIFFPKVFHFAVSVGFKLNLVFFSIKYDLISYLITFLYYFTLESTIKRTIGKFATQTVVIDEYGNPPSKSKIAIRTLARLIPFEIFSCLGSRGWHDKLSNTFVVSKKEAETLRSLLQDENGYAVSDSLELLD